ncbi:MAG: phospho-sugar mutase [Bacteroidaceae bacterium]|nr:phospho-sugar mutase [Prevotellaceae bacterium]MDY2849994.1 phospho-sugar mutase [Bacteroidaceae bacterium]
MTEQELLVQKCSEVAKLWLTPAFDAKTQEDVKQMLDSKDKTALVDAFYKNLEFGTGGLRGIMGAGTNRMNKYIVGMATQGFANYLKQAFSDKKEIAVVVGHDCRNNSRFFAETVADIFSANDIKVYLFESLRPTPEISFAIRQLKAQGGVNITASHNPKEYNGYKAYWDDGAQVLSPHDTGIISEVNKVTIDQVKFQPNNDLIKIIGGEMDIDYLNAVHEALIDQDVINRQKDLCIVYSPLHGTGRVVIPAALRTWGFQNINVVKEQMVIDGNFPTVVSPNPENAEAMTLGMKLGTRLNAELVLASDPDADRLAVVCRDPKGEWYILNGNQTALMLSYYIIENKKKLGQLKGNEFMVKTIVTTETIKEIAERNGVEIRDVYTGFKWIAREIRLSEGEKKYIGGGEESFGYLPFDKVRDKDSPASICLLCEIAAWAKNNGMSLYDLLMKIYIDYGFAYQNTISVTKPGKSGADEIRQMMENFRKNPPQTLGGSAVVCIKDYSTLKMYANGNTTNLSMPDYSNVLQWFTADGTKISVRPSGTEPKIKFYIEVKGEMDAPESYEASTAKAKSKVDAIKANLNI